MMIIQDNRLKSYLTIHIILKGNIFLQATIIAVQYCGAYLSSPFSNAAALILFNFVLWSSISANSRLIVELKISRKYTVEVLLNVKAVESMAMIIW